MPHTVVLSGQTSVRRISALHAKHFMCAPSPPVADTLMKPTLHPSEVAPYRRGSLLGRGLEPCPLQGPRRAPARAPPTPRSNLRNEPPELRERAKNPTGTKSLSSREELRPQPVQHRLIAAENG